MFMKDCFDLARDFLIKIQVDWAVVADYSIVVVGYVVGARQGFKGLTDRLALSTPYSRAS